MTATLTRQQDTPGDVAQFVPAPMVPGTIAGRSTRVTMQHRENNATPIALDMSVTIPMSLGDVTAVLWILWSGLCCPLEELSADQAFMHRMVLETYLAEGGSRIEEALCHLAGLTPADAAYADAQRLRDLVTRVYSTAPAAAPRGSRQHGSAVAR
jgi:hypothetical protein